MRFMWLRFTTSVRLRLADTVNRRIVRYVYWSIMLTLVLGSVVFAAVQRYINPDHILVTGDLVSVGIEMRETFSAFASDRREADRLGDFDFVLEQLGQNYPFFEMAQRGGVDISHLSIQSLYELSEQARYTLDHTFLWEFINDSFVSAFHPLGGISLTSELGQLPAWLQLPYFFGQHDWRFDDDRMYVPTRDDNITVEMIDENVMYMRISSFLAKGYDDADRRPFWHYNFAEERRRIGDIVQNANQMGVEYLVIDIRGISVGFGEYFLPLIIEPNITEPISTTVYGFHMDGGFAHWVSAAFREWYGVGDLQSAAYLAPNLPMANEEDFANLTHGFRMEIEADPWPTHSDMFFDGTIWILTDAHNYVSKNLAYLELARQAGFNIVFWFDEYSEYVPTRNNAWGTEINAPQRLPNSRNLVLRYNPLYFTDADGRAFEFMRHSEVARGLLSGTAGPIDAILWAIRGSQ